MVAEISRQIEDSIAVKQAVLRDPAALAQVERVALVCCDSLRGGGKIVFAGNGGSFADAQHLSAEFTSRFQFDRAPLASLALATNSSAISAIGNDYGFDQVFARELEAVAKPGDVYIPITTSGNSPNIIESIWVARRLGLPTFCLTGQSGGLANGLCECIRVPSQVTARIQECHILLGHILCGLLENMIFKAPGGPGREEYA
ncbi:SIS domain-containing protein [Azospira restricta]|uniref:SIS domain-containing protein n=1 Tax=Azospira restricta TaxID=404405 RepID=A0A974SSM5_9RHOO|nr:SIS domain-containing protein [Azospira restricta]